LLWEEDIYGVRRGREFAVGEGDLYGEEEKRVCCGRKISMERRRREFAVGEGDLYGEEEKRVCCGRKISMG
jgi:hypothetical protein